MRQMICLLFMSILLWDSVGQLPYRSKNFDKTFKSFLKDVTLKFEMSFILMKFLSSNTFLLKKEIQPMTQNMKLFSTKQHFILLRSAHLFCYGIRKEQ